MFLNRHTAKGFTLIELLVVIAIISILAAILFPVFARAKSAAHDATTISNLKQLGAAFTLYAGDNDDGLPNVCDSIAGEKLEGGWVYYDVFGQNGAGHFIVEKGSLYPYVKSKEVYTSPNDPSHLASGLSFAFNGCLLTQQYSNVFNTTKTMTASDNPSGTMLLGEEQGVNNQGTDDGFLHPAGGNGVAEWHAGGTALLFLDTHAKIKHVKDRLQEVLSGGPDPCWPMPPKA